MGLLRFFDTEIEFWGKLKKRKLKTANDFYNNYYFDKFDIEFECLIFAVKIAKEGFSMKMEKFLCQ